MSSIGRPRIRSVERNICAQHASQAQQSWSPESDPREEFWRCVSASSEDFSERVVSVRFIKQNKKEK